MAEIKEYRAILFVRMIGANNEEIAHKLENLCEIMREIEDIVEDVTVDDYYEVSLG